MSTAINAIDADDDDDTDFGSLEPIEKVRTIDGKKYIIREASADAAVQYRNSSTKAAKMTDGKLSGFDGLADAEPLLVGLCVFATNAEGRALQKSVGIATVKGWPNRVQKKCYDLIRKISPDLIDKPMTIEEVDKQIAKLQERREELLAKEAGVPDTKAQAGSMQVTSGSPES